MSRTFYSDYVSHCLRTYFAVSKKDVLQERIPRVEKNNWVSCYNVLKDYDQEHIQLLKVLYCSEGYLPDIINSLHREKGIPQNTVWNFISGVERKIAKKRGLIP